MYSVTRLSDFWNFLVAPFIAQVTQMFGDFLGSFQILCFLSQHVGKIWAILFQHLVTLPVRQKRFTTLVPGVHFSMPFITRVEQINVRLVTENVPPIEISTNDGVSANFVDVQV